MYGNPNYGDLRYDPTRFQPTPAPVNTAAPAGEWLAKPLPPSRPTGVNPTPASPTLSPRPLSGPVAAPPVAKLPISPGGLGAAAGAVALLPQLGNALGDAARDIGNLGGAAYDAGKNPGRGNLGVALVTPGLAPIAGLGIGSNQSRPAVVPDWLWPFPDPPGLNETDPAALDAGPEIEPGVPPPFTGGQSVGVFYNVRATVSEADNGCNETSGPIEVNGVPGPINFSSRHNTAFSEPQGGLCPGFSYNEYFLIDRNGQQAFAGSGRGVRVTGISVTRADGQPDTGGNPPGEVAPVRAPNPARQPTSATPRVLPSPTPTPSDLPWPETAPQKTPDTTPISPPAPTPNFSPTPTPETVPPTAPGTTPQPTDLEGPRETPPNLGTDPLTPPVEDPLKPLDKTKPTSASKSPLSALNNPLAPLAVAIPVVILDGLRQKVNTPSGNLIDRTQPNPNIQVVKAPPPPTVNIPNPPTCIYERERVRDIQNKATDVQAQASNPTSGFLGLYGIGIESRLKLGQTFTLLESVNQFMRKAWQTTRMQKVLDVLTFVGVMHNVSMLSREVGETFFYLVSQGLDVVGIDDEEGNALDIGSIVGTSVNNYLVSVFGEAFVDGVRDSYRKANRIVQSASMVIWTIRSIQDSSLDLMEWVAENTGKIGNALKRFGVVGDRAYPWMSEQAQARERNRARFSKLTDTLENAEDRLSSYTVATSTILETQQEVEELGENWGSFKESLNEVPNPWFDNEPVQDQVTTETAASQSPNITAADTQKTE